MELERVVKYDKLGRQRRDVATRDHHGPEPVDRTEQFLPMLNRVVKNDSFMHQARSGRPTSADQIRNTK